MYTPQFSDLRKMYKNSCEGTALAPFMPKAVSLMKPLSLEYPHNNIDLPGGSFVTLKVLLHEFSHGIHFMVEGKAERILEKDFGFCFGVRKESHIDLEIETVAYELAFERLIMSHPKYPSYKKDWSILTEGVDFINTQRNRLRNTTTWFENEKTMLEKWDIERMLFNKSLYHDVTIQSLATQLDDFLDTHGVYKQIKEKWPL